MTAARRSSSSRARSATSRLFVLTPPSGGPRQTPSASSTLLPATPGSPPARPPRARPTERRAAPDPQRLLAPLTSDSRLAVCARRTCPLERLLPAIDITLAGSHDQQIAARLTDQPAGVGARLGQPLAQPRDMHLQAVARTRGRVLTPKFVDEPVGRHHATAHQGQDREQRPRPRTPSATARPSTRASTGPSNSICNPPRLSAIPDAIACPRSPVR